MADYTFAQLLRDLVNQSADGVQNKFASMIGVSSATMSRLINSESRPELETLERISKVTGTNLITLIHLAYPDGVFGEVSPTAQVVADQFDKLPSELQAAIVAMMRGAKAKG
jgi:transcriptional regulator with XRE-family HTH domain